MIFRPVVASDLRGIEPDPIVARGVEPAQALLVPVVDCGELLTHIPPTISRLNVYENLEPNNNWDWARESVVQRLILANDALPSGIHLVVLNAYRTTNFQLRLLSHYFPNKDDAGTFVSDPTDPDLRAPHTTGGAVDLTLGVEGEVLELGNPFDDFGAKSSLRYWESFEKTPQRDARRLLSTVMTHAGFVSYPSEWWHWSYGEQFWAATKGSPTALYDTVV